MDWQNALDDAIRLRRAYDAPTRRYKNEQIFQEATENGVSISVAGSNDYRDWYQNLTAWRWWDVTKWWSFHSRIPGTNWKATSGYVDAAKNVVEMIERGLLKSAKLYFAGHSKGGPVAAIAGLMMQKQGYNVRGITTFCSPRWTVQDIDEPLVKAIRNYQVKGDVVPEFPKPTAGREWQVPGRIIKFGETFDKYAGIVRDGIGAHLIGNVIVQLKQEIAKNGS